MCFSAVVFGLQGFNPLRRIHHVVGGINRCAQVFSRGSKESMISDVCVNASESPCGIHVDAMMVQCKVSVSALHDCCKLKTRLRSGEEAPPCSSCRDNLWAQRSGKHSV